MIDVSVAGINSGYIVKLNCLAMQKLFEVYVRHCPAEERNVTDMLEVMRLHDSVTDLLAAEVTAIEGKQEESYLQAEKRQVLEQTDSIPEEEIEEIRRQVGLKEREYDAAGMGKVDRGFEDARTEPIAITVAKSGARKRRKRPASESTDAPVVSDS